MNTKHTTPKRRIRATQTAVQHIAQASNLLEHEAHPFTIAQERTRLKNLAWALRDFSNAVETILAGSRRIPPEAAPERESASSEVA